MMDNYELWKRHEDAKEKKLAELPRCSECDEYIQTDSAFVINDEWICEECMENYRRYID